MGGARKSEEVTPHHGVHQRPEAAAPRSRRDRPPINESTIQQPLAILSPCNLVPSWPQATPLPQGANGGGGATRAVAFNDGGLADGDLIVVRGRIAARA